MRFGGEEGEPLSVEANKALVRSFYEAQAEGDLDALKQLLAPNFVDHSVLPGQAPDRESYIRGVVEDHAAFSDIRHIIEDQAADGDKVISRITTRGTHDRKDFMGAVSTGRKWEMTGIAIHRISGDRILEEWSESGGPQILTQQRLEQEMRERELLEHELRVARSIQQASLPKEVPQPEGWQISPYYQPAREVGGDFYDFHLLSEDQLGVVVGDATGKGVPAALVMSTTCGMLQLAAQALDSSPGEVLERVNETLLSRIPSNMFVTCFYAILEPKSGCLRYANAGHDLPYLHRNGEAEELRARGMPLGLMPGMSYEEKETILEAGDSALFYSDGLVEAHNPEGEMFGFPRLRALIAQHGEEERVLREFLMKELHSFTGEGWEQEDDITLVTLQRSTQ
jgi:predicted ester cyclase